MSAEGNDVNIEIAKSVTNDTKEHANGNSEQDAEEIKCKIAKKDIISSEDTPQSGVEDTDKTDVESKPPKEINLRIIFNKQKYDIKVMSNSLVKDLKTELHKLLDVPQAMQKLMYKGLLQDNQTIEQAGCTDGCKVMLVGSKLNDVLAISTVGQAVAESSEKVAQVKEPLCNQKLHRAVLDKGKPDDAMMGIRNSKDCLPNVPLSGMINKLGGKVRLTFKLESDQLWLSTKERTEKIPMGTIKNVISEPIKGNEEYHILALQLGPTDASKYWIYWVPAQYVDAIKDTILGKWQSF